MSAPFAVGDLVVVSRQAPRYTQAMFARETGEVVEIVDALTVVVAFAGVRVLGYRNEFRRLRRAEEEGS